MSNVGCVAEQIEKGLHLIPPHMRGVISRYLLNGTPPGNFLTAILSNDFMEACGRADEDNARAMTGWAVFLYNYAPCGSHGSPENFRDWIKGGGIAGRETAEAEAA